MMGSNQYGECGFDEKTENIEKPTLLIKNENIVDVCCGYYHSFILISKKNNKK